MGQRGRTGAAALILRMKPPSLSPQIDSLPKAELHLHLEGSIQPATVRTLMARHGVKASEQEVLERYAFHDFPGFLETFKWVTSFLRSEEHTSELQSRLHLVCRLLLE